MPNYRKTLALLTLVLLLILSACHSEQGFSFEVIKNGLESRLVQQKALVQTLPELELKLQSLEKKVPLSPEELAQETREHAEARFGIGYYYKLEDYTAAEQTQLESLENQLAQLAPKLERVFELEARIRVLERSLE